MAAGREQILQGGEQNSNVDCNSVDNRVKVGFDGLLHHPSEIWISSFSIFLSETFNIL